MHRFLALLLPLATVLSPLSAQAPIPATLSFQGRLALQGGGVANGVLPFTFRIYNLPTGGLARWTESNPAVSANNGLFAVELGSITGFPTDLFDGRALYLGVQVNNDPEMVPRLSIPSQAYAQLAVNALDVPGRDIHPNSVSIARALSSTRTASGSGRRPGPASRALRQCQAASCWSGPPPTASTWPVGNDEAVGACRPLTRRAGNGR